MKLCQSLADALPIKLQKLYRRSTLICKISFLILMAWYYICDFFYAKE